MFMPDGQDNDYHRPDVLNTPFKAATSRPRSLLANVHRLPELAAPFTQNGGD